MIEIEKTAKNDFEVYYVNVSRFELTGVVFYKIKGTNTYHREDGPAVIYGDGTKFWYYNGKLHRKDGPAHETPDGLKEWWVNGKRHRVDGPAVTLDDGHKEWWINDIRHREDGPAIIHTDGKIYWVLNGFYFNTKEEWFEELTEEQKEKALYSEYFIGS